MYYYTTNNTPWSIKSCHFYFYSTVNHWLIIIIFCTRHQKETRRKGL